MITVNLSDPPPWVVNLGAGASEMTWPFDDREAAVNAYELAVISGQFTYQMKRVTVTLVSLWRREWRTDEHGERYVMYVGEDPTS